VGLKEKYPFRLLVDDAHGFGTLGETGAGAGEEQGVMEDIDVYFATFAKSMASIGAFLAGDKMVMDFLRYNLRSQIFAKSLPMPLVEGNLLRLKMLQEKSELRENLWRVVRALQGGLTSAGFNIGVTNSCVTPVFLKGSVEEAMALVYDLRTNYRIFCSIVIYPVIPKGEIILRLIPTAVHSLDDVNRSIEAFTAIQGRLQDGTYRKMAESYQSS
jgi:glycine C-acetyltransferase